MRGRDLRWTPRGLPAPEWIINNWPGSATILAMRCKGKRDGKQIDETLTTSPSQDHSHSLAATCERPLVDREQLALAARCAAAGTHPPLPREQRRPDPGHAAPPGRQCPALEVIWSISERIVALAHDIKGLLRLLGWRPAVEGPSG